MSLVLIMGKSFNPFPLQYQRAVWLPAAGMTFGFLFLEIVIEHGHPMTGSFASWKSLRFGLCLLNLVPFVVPTIRRQNGTLRRILIGCFLQLFVGVGFLLFHSIFPLYPNLVPSFYVANIYFLYCLVGRMERPSWRYLALPVVLFIGFSEVWIDKNGLINASLGLLMGSIAYRIAFSIDLSFLDQPYPWRRIKFELRNLYNIFIFNKWETWESAYASGQWDFLNSLEQRPRYYTISGIIRDRFPKGSDVLDVGCGYATLYPLLDRAVTSYTGIDLSEAVIKECRRLFKEDNRCSFEVTAFEKFQPDRKFDVVVLNEVPYYFPWKMVKDTFLQAVHLLKDDRSVLIISMNRNIKAGIIWKKLSHVASPKQSVRATNSLTGSYWTVNVYRIQSRLSKVHA